MTEAKAVLFGVDQEGSTTSTGARAPRPVAQCYLVSSPEWSYGSDDYYETPEFGRDFVFVFSRNTRRAKVLALRWFRRTYRSSEDRDPRDYLAAGENPFHGMKVEKFNPVPEPCARCNVRGYPGCEEHPCLCCWVCEGTGIDTTNWDPVPCVRCKETGREAVACELAFDRSRSTPDDFDLEVF
jgi:hypothetical protein